MVKILDVAVIGTCSIEQQKKFRIPTTRTTWA